MAACHGKAETGASWPPTTLGSSLKLIPHSSRLAADSFIATGAGIGVVVGSVGGSVALVGSVGSSVALVVEVVVVDLVVAGLTVVLGVVIGFGGGL